MSDVALPVGLLDTLIALIVGALTALLGIIYRRLLSRINALEDEVGDFEDEHANIHRKLDTVFAWAFGNDEDATDRGFAGDMDDQFDDLAEQLEEIQERLDDRHEEISRRIDDLINALHDEESLEFDRDDVD